jgi:site-specific recombinase XerD
MRVIQELLGHSDFYLAMNTYSHVIPEQKREAADKPVSPIPQRLSAA